MNREDREEFARLYDNSPETIGGWGEVITASALRNELDLRVIRTLYIGKSQIDMIAIDRACVIVVENKNYHATVSGNTYDKTWTVRYSPYRTHSLYNPVMQNAAHVADVCKLLELSGFSGICVRSLVIFNDLVKLSLTGKTEQVYKLQDFIASYKRANIEPVLSEEDVNHLVDLFERFRDCSDEAKQEHLDGLRGRLMCEAASL